MDKNNEIASKLYNSMADTYDNIDNEAFYINQYNVYDSVIDKFLNEMKNKNILDLGCGTGIQTFRIAPICNKIIGIDISTQLLEKATKKCSNLNNVTFKEADATLLPFENNSFDIVISFGETISHINDYEKAYKESLRVLKPGGYFIFSVLNKWNIGLFYSLLELKSAVWLKDGHFRIWKCEDDNGNETQMELKTFSRDEIQRILKKYNTNIIYSQGIHICSLIIPLIFQRGVLNIFGKIFYLLGNFDKLYSSIKPICNFGYTCLYVSKKELNNE